MGLPRDWVTRQVRDASVLIKFQSETRALPPFTGNLDIPVKAIAEAFHDCQADTKTRIVVISGAMKRLENTLDARLRNTRAAVDDRLLVSLGRDDGLNIVKIL